MQKLQQFYVLKFNSSRLKKDKYDININIKTARKNGELIALGDNQVLRATRLESVLRLRKNIFDTFAKEGITIFEGKNAIRWRKKKITAC